MAEAAIEEKIAEKQSPPLIEEEDPEMVEGQSPVMMKCRNHSGMKEGDEYDERLRRLLTDSQQCAIGSYIPPNFLPTQPDEEQPYNG